MKICKFCKFCRKSTKAHELKKRTVKLPHNNLPITSLDPMCNECWGKIKNHEFKAETK